MSQIVFMMDNFVWQDVLRLPISYLLKGAYYVTQNYTLALLLFALIFQVILFPLGIKQQKNMIKQAALRPKEQAIRKKYEGRTDEKTKQIMNQEIMDLYQRENFNPAGGCLPLLIQFPILFALVSVVYDPLKYLCSLSGETITNIGNKITELVTGITDFSSYNLSDTIVSKLSSSSGVSGLTGLEKIKVMEALGTEKFADIFDITKLPNFKLLGSNLLDTPTLKWPPDILILIPILTFVVYFLSMRLTRKMTYQPQQNADQMKSMQMMDYMMPLFSLWITFMYPAAIGIYWIFRSVLGTVQQFILKKILPYPTYTDEELKAAMKEYKAQNKQENKKTYSTAAAPVGEKKPVRSLHHIDDDDYDEKGRLKPESERTPAQKTDESEPTATKSEAAASPMSGMLSGGKLKEDKNDKES